MLGGGKKVYKGIRILLVICFVKKGYGLVTACSASHNDEAECDMAGFSQTPGRIPFLQSG